MLILIALFIGDIHFNENSAQVTLYEKSSYECLVMHFSRNDK